jgi:HD-like signal output (HDOD) protein
MKLFDLPELAVADSVKTDLLQTFSGKIQIRGDFPSSLTLLEKVFHMIDSGQSTSAAVAEMLRADHVLALRLISIVNHEHYRPNRPVYSVAGAVDHLGLLKLKDILHSLAEAKNFNAIFLGHAVSLTMMQQAILASVIAKDLGEQLASKEEVGDLAYLATVLSNLGPLLLSFYEPQYYSVLSISCQDDYLQFKENFTRYLGVTLGGFAAQVVKTLALPEEFLFLAESLDQTPWEQLPRKSSLKKAKEILIAVRASNMIAHEVANFTGIQGVQSVLRYLEKEAAIPEPMIEDVLCNVADVYIDHCETLFLKPMRLPEYLTWFARETDIQSVHPWQKRLPKLIQRVNPFQYDLRQCMKKATEAQKYPLFPQAIFLTLQTLTKGLNFDRAVFFRVVNEDELRVGINVGVKLFQPESYVRKLGTEEELNQPDRAAFHRKMPSFTGDPLFADGWPFAAFPAILGGKVIGIFYADKIRKPDVDALSNQEQLACTALAEEWRDIPAHLL